MIKHKKSITVDINIACSSLQERGERVSEVSSPYNNSSNDYAIIELKMLSHDDY